MILVQIPIPADERSFMLRQYAAIPNFFESNAGYGVGSDAFNLYAYDSATNTYADNVYHLKELSTSRYEVYSDKALTIPVPTNT